MSTFSVTVPVAVHDHRGGEAERLDARIEEVLEELAVAVADPRPGQVERRQVGVALQRVALLRADQLAGRRGFADEAADVVHEAGIEPPLQRDRPDHRHDDGRHRRRDAEQPDDIGVQPGAGLSGAPGREQLPGLAGDEQEQHEGDDAVGQEHVQHHGVGGRDRRVAGEHREARQRRGQRQGHHDGRDPQVQAPVVAFHRRVVEAVLARLIRQARPSVGRDPRRPSPQGPSRCCRSGRDRRPLHLYSTVAGLQRIQGAPRGRAPSLQRGRRISLMSSSRTFLRSVLRFRPSISAALIWLPRVAARAADTRGTSSSRRTRW